MIKGKRYFSVFTRTKKWRLPPAASRQNQPQQNENANKNHYDGKPGYVYPVKLCHKQTKASKNYYQSYENAYKGYPSCMITEFSFVAYVAPITSAFAVGAVKRRTTINANRGILCIVGSTLSAVNHFSFSAYILVMEQIHIRFVVCSLPHNQIAGEQEGIKNFFSGKFYSSRKCGIAPISFSNQYLAYCSKLGISCLSSSPFQKEDFALITGYSES
jgi:hypothetical protein